MRRDVKGYARCTKKHTETSESTLSRQSVRTAVVRPHSRLPIVFTNIPAQGLCADFLRRAVDSKAVRGEKVNSC